MTDAVNVERVDLESLQRGKVHHLRVDMVRDGLGEMIRMPVIVVRGALPGPTVGVTAAIHGNELNGVRIIQRLLPELDPASLSGTIVAVPVVNVPGYLRTQREFSDRVDLNRIMPGREGGTESEVYAARFLDRVVRVFDYLIDLHTASFGRVNSLYVRADMKNPVTARMAYLQSPQIIVHNAGSDHTLRGAADEMGIPAITVEVGDPQRFQRKMIKSSLVGTLNVLEHLAMIDDVEDEPSHEPILCGRSFWIYTDRGGVLDVLPDVAARVTKGQLIARVTDVFGSLVREYHAPEDGIVVGKSSNPVNQAGSRVVHLGIEGMPESFPDPTQSLAGWPKLGINNGDDDG